jgi:hypothetical protein
MGERVNPRLEGLTPGRGDAGDAGLCGGFPQLVSRGQLRAFYTYTVVLNLEAYLETYSQQ